MLVKNNSTRLYHVGGVAIVPGESKEINDKHAADIKGVAALEVVSESPKKVGRPAKVDESAKDE